MKGVASEVGASIPLEKVTALHCEQQVITRRKAEVKCQKGTCGGMQFAITKRPHNACQWTEKVMKTGADKVATEKEAITSNVLWSPLYTGKTNDFPLRTFVT